MKKAIVLLLTILFFFLLVFSVFYRFGLPYMYLIFSALLSMLSILIVYKAKKSYQWVAYLLVIVLFVFLRVDYNVASGFSFIPLADGYQDYAVARMVMESGRCSVIGPNTGLIGLQSPSSWPLLHILAASISEITTINLLSVVLILPLAFSLLIFAFVFLFIRKIAHKFGLGNRFVLLSMLICAITPDNVETQMQFVRQSFALVFFTIIVYFFLCEILIDESKNTFMNKALLIFFTLVLVLTHDYTPFTLLLFCSALFALLYIVHPIATRRKITISALRFPVFFIIFTLTALLAWWTFHATVIWTAQGWVLQGFLHPRIRIFTYTLESAEMRWGYYNVLRPQLYTCLLNIRDAAIYVPSLIAFLIYGIRTFQRKKLTAHESFLMYSIVAFSLVLIYYEFILGLQPMRVIWLGAPLIAYFAASFYEYAFSRKRAILRIVVFSLMTLTIFSAFLSPWAHLYVSSYLYEPSIGFEDVGSHNIHFSSVIPFVKKYMPSTEFEAFLSDDPHLMYIVLPPESYQKIRDLHMSPDIVSNNTGSTAIFDFLHLNPSFHILNVISEEHPEVLENLESFKQEIMSKYDLVYNAGFSKIYVAGNSSGG